MNLKENLLNKIRDKELRMKPRYVFSLQVLLTGLVGFIVLFFSVFIFNFIFFSIRVSGHSALLGFGPRGLLAFVTHFPWGFLAMDILLLILLEKLLRRFKFGYRAPVLYLFIALFAVVISAGFIIDRSSDVNDRLLGKAERHELPLPLGNFYHGARRPWPEGFPTTTPR